MDVYLPEVHEADNSPISLNNDCNFESFMNQTHFHFVDEVNQNLEWFREQLLSEADMEQVTSAKFAHAAKQSPDFAVRLFMLFDTDSSGSVSQQELIGGLSRLTIKGKKKKILKWFEEVFLRTSGEDQLLQLDEFAKAIKIPGFTEKLFDLMDDKNTDKLTVAEIVDALTKLSCMDKDAYWLAWFENQFSDIAGDDRQIDLEEFKGALQLSKSTFFVERFFSLFDSDNSGTISLRELMDGLTMLSQGSSFEKLRFLFRVFDVDGNGMIDYEELKTALKSCMDESVLTFSSEDLEELSTALFEDADTDQSGTVSFEELQQAIENHPGCIIEHLTINAANLLKPQRALRKTLRDRIPNWMTWKHFKNNWSYFAFLAIFYAINIALFIAAAVQYRNSGILVSLARGGGACLNFDPIIVLILMYRQIITFLRSTPISPFLPLDKYIKLHKIVGYTILFFSVEHFLAHLANFSRIEVENQSNYTIWMYLFGIGSVGTNLGWVGGAAGLTGFLLIIILLIMFVCSLPVVRRKGKFEVFYWTHILFILWYIILILHGPNFWKWFIGPAFIFMIEKIARSKLIKFFRYGRTYIQEVNLLSSKVTHLVITKPSNFLFQPGDYIFIQVPAIARYEWHPFTISSAPEVQGTFSLHIRGVGSWTNKLYEYFERRDNVKQKKWKPLPNTDNNKFQVEHSSSKILNDVVIKLDCNKSSDVIQIYIDGPYGTPTAHIFEAEHAVLIGTGIGVTPFASILQSIMNRFKHAKQICPKCNNCWISELPSTILKLKKVDFFWINRHQKHFEWFISLLSELEIEQNELDAMERFLDMHMYITSALKKTDIKAILLQMALDLIHKKKNIDLITGLQTRTQPGRPNWDKVFQELKNNKRGQISVFFCGSPVIGRILRLKCTQYGFKFHKENF